MKQIPTIAKALPIAIIVAFFATRRVHGRYFDETFICDTGDRCELGSGLSWLLTGITALGPFLAVLGFMWTWRLHHRDRLGPFSHRAIPDSEQILEVLAVLGGILASYWLLLNGPSIESVTIGRPNTWAEWLRNFRAPEQLTSADREKLEQVPSRLTWFAVGTLLGGPFMYAFGSMLGREWYGRKRRKAQKSEAAHREEGVAGDDASDTINLTGDLTGDLTGNRSPDLDLTNIESDFPTDL